MPRPAPWPVSRRDNTYKSSRDLYTKLAAAMPLESAVLDGEIVHLDADGKRSSTICSGAAPRSSSSRSMCYG
jgi:hypothetical protein